MANPGADWSSDENDALISAYLDILTRELRGERVVKRQRVLALQPRLNHRTRAAIEFKMQNVSAVLRDEGLPWVRGFKPARNYQGALGEGVRQVLADDAHLRSTLASAEPTG